MGPEKKFETKVKNYLSTKGIYALGTERQKMIIQANGYYEKRFANRNTKRGLPDMHICIKGLSIELELKADNGKPSELQIRMCQQIRESGGCAYIVYPSAFDKLKEIIANMLYGRIDENPGPIILK